MADIETISVSADGTPIVQMKIFDKETGTETPVNVETCTQAVKCSQGIPVEEHLANLYDHANDEGSHLTVEEKAELETQTGAQEKADTAKSEAVTAASLLVESAKVEAATDADEKAKAARDAAYKYTDETATTLRKFTAGLIYPLASAVIPAGFLLCDGAAYSRTDYPELFEAIGTIYGRGDGKTTFNVPNLSKRVPVGAGGEYELGATGGEESHQLTVEELPKHNHTVHESDHGSQITVQWTNKLDTVTGTQGAVWTDLNGAGSYLFTNSVGSTQPHNNMQPYTVVNYIIATGKGKTIGYAVAPAADGGDAAVIDDSVVSLDKTWSSQKIADEIANDPSGGGVGDMDISGDDIVVFTANDFAFRYNDWFGDKIVDDAGAYGSKAACYTTSDTVLKMRHSCREGELVIGDLAFADMTSNYQTYKFTYIVPTTAAATDKFLLHNDGYFQMDNFGGFAKCAGQTVEIYLSMKAIANDGTYSYYLDRVVIAICDETDSAYDTIDAIPAEHLASVRDYSDFDTNPEGSTVCVDDSEAYGGKAVCDTSGYASLTITHTGTGYRNRIGTLAASELASKEGYQVYKFTYDVPAEAEYSGRVYIMPNWSLFSNTLANDLVPYAGKTVELYFSIKVVENSNGTYTTYVDRVALAKPCSFTNYVDNGDGTSTAACDYGCGKTDIGYTSIDNILAAHKKHQRVSANFSYCENVADPQSFNGSAAKGTTTGKTLTIKQRHYVGGWGNRATTTLIGAPVLADMAKVNGYKVYEYIYTPPENGYSLYMLDNAGMVCTQLGWYDLNEYAGQTIKLYFSIKVEETATAGTYDVYVDRVALATLCSFTNYVSNGDGTFTATCDAEGCGKTLTKKADNPGKTYNTIEEIPAYKLASVSCFSAVTDTGKVAYVDDDALRGKAARLTAVSRIGEPHNGLYVGKYSLPIRMIYPDGSLKTIIYINRHELTVDGKYHLYKINNEILLKQEEEYKAFSMFNDESFQIPSAVTKLTEYTDKKVDIYISMKITGDITFADACNLPVFYIDRVIVTNGAKELFPGTGVMGHHDEWSNPPLIPGVEYKTPEKYNDKPVYVKNFNFGYLPKAGESGHLMHGLNPTQVLRAQGQLLGGMDVCDILPYHRSGCGNITIAVSNNSIQISVLDWVLDEDISTLTASIQVWYTKD